MSNSTYAFIFVVCFLVGASFMVWRDEHRARIAEHEARIRSETIRPYLVIEELTAVQLRAEALSSPINPALPEGAYDRAYLIVQTPEGELFFYNFRNVGKITAREIKHYQKITTIGNGPGETLYTAPSRGGNMVLIPERSMTRNVSVQKGTFFTGVAGEQGKLRITLVVTYSGQPSDKNTYFYKTVLIARRHRDSTEMSRALGVGVGVESMDEGIVSDMNELIQ